MKERATERKSWILSFLLALAMAVTMFARVPVMVEAAYNYQEATIEPENAGTVEYTMNSAERWDYTAKPNQGYEFDRWEYVYNGNTWASQQNPRTFYDGENNIKVFFKEITHVTKIQLNKSSVYGKTGDVFKLEATISPSDASLKKVKWGIQGNPALAKFYANRACTQEIEKDVLVSNLTVYAKLQTDPLGVYNLFSVESEEGSNITAYTHVYNESAKEASEVQEPPAANTLTYTGSAQELVTAGIAIGGVMKYAIGTDATTVPTDGWSKSIPKGTDAKTYYVWYKVVGDDSHKDTEAQNVPVTIKNAIQHTVTFKVVNGKWNDGINADKIVTLKGAEGDTLKLTADQIPEVGNKPSSSYKAGSWDVTPSTETAITKDTTYTYAYGQKADNPATITDTVSVVAGGKKINLANCVNLNGATGAVSYSLSGDAGGCSLNGSILTSGSAANTVYVNVTVAEDDNYKALDAKRITVSVTDKPQQVLEAEDVSVTYGETDKKVTATVTTPATGGGAITYAVKDGSGDYIDVDASTGLLTIKAVPADGKAYVTAKAAETDTYAEATQDVTITIAQAPVTPKVELNKTTLSLTVNEESTLTATTVPEGQQVTWTSSDAAIAAVDTTGKVTAKAAGTAKVTATITVEGQEYKAECDVTVTAAPTPVTPKVELNKTALALTVNEESTLTATTVPEGQQVTWTSFDAAIAAVDTTGKVTAKAAGTAKVTATITVEGQEYKAECDVTVTAPAPTPVPSETIVVPEALSDDNLSPEIIERYGSAERVTLRLEEVMSVTPESRANSRVYDARVMVITDQGERPATADDITPEGLEAIFPYPDGTNKDDYTFSGAHMMGESGAGYQAGDIEQLSFTNGEDGLHTRVHGLSPVIITWTIRDTPAEPGDGIDRHVHVYEWDTINATADQDGEMRYQCRICGNIQIRVPITAYYIFNKETTEKIRRAKQGETVKIETARWISFHKMVMEALADRPDVTLEVSFLDEEHKGTRKSFTIPAGTADVTSLVDDKGFAGFIYLTNKFGNTVTTP
jgi:uncharacterized protein YjdB